jgi:hypothetical protein
MIYWLRFIGGPEDGAEEAHPFGKGYPAIVRLMSGATYQVKPDAEIEQVTETIRSVPMTFVGYLSDAEFMEFAKRV